MYSALRNILRMSALRNALVLAMVFLAIMLLAGTILRFELTRQAYDAIDDDLILSAERFETAASASHALHGSLDAAHIGISYGFMSPKGEVLGPIKARVFDTPGFRNLSGSALFSARGLTPAGLDDLDGHDDVHEWEDDLETWRVLVVEGDEGLLAVFTPIHEVEDTLDLLPQIMWPITIATVIATLIGGVVLGLVQQRRIIKVQSAFEQIASGNLGHRIDPQSSRDDMDDLMHGFDTAAVQLETSVQQMRDFSRNVAHELRTPLSERHLALERLEEGPEQELALARADKVLRTFDAILRISRLSAGVDRSHLQLVNLNDVAQSLFDLYADSVDETGQTLSLQLGDGGTVIGDRQLLLQLGSNLIENAKKYAGAGARITIRTDARRLVVSDTGPGIPEAERNRVLQPLFMLDRARSRQGSGLGLALVKAIADHHKAALDLRSGPDGGLTVSVLFERPSEA